jgi:cytochrome d ubiquinol oxidase subunit I
MRTQEALTPRTGLEIYLYVTVTVYLVLSVGLVAILRRIAAGPTPPDSAPQNLVVASNADTESAPRHIREVAA